MVRRLTRSEERLFEGVSASSTRVIIETSSRSRTDQHSDGQSSKESTGEHHAFIGRGSLQSSTKQEDDGSDKDCIIDGGEMSVKSRIPSRLHDSLAVRRENLSAIKDAGIHPQKALASRSPSIESAHHLGQSDSRRVFQLTRVSRRRR